MNASFEFIENNEPLNHLVVSVLLLSGGMSHKSISNFIQPFFKLERGPKSHKAADRVPQGYKKLGRWALHAHAVFKLACNFEESHTY